MNGVLLLLCFADGYSTFVVSILDDPFRYLLLMQACDLWFVGLFACVFGIESELSPKLYRRKRSISLSVPPAIRQRSGRTMNQQWDRLTRFDSRLPSLDGRWDGKR